jgi:hypothetical protein
MAITQRPTDGDYAPALAGYVAEIQEQEAVLSVLDHQLGELQNLVGSLPAARGDYRYAPGKWTVKDIVGHLSDTERVFAFRALWIARGEQRPQPPFDDQSWVAHTGADHRTLGDMVEEWGVVRRATHALYHSLPPDAWQRRGTAGDGPITVLALAYVIAGHTRHHQRVLVARYLR